MARREGSTPGEVAEKAPDDSDALRHALAEAIRDPGHWSALRLAVECQGENGARSLEALGNGVAVWNDRRQFALTPTELGRLLRLLEDADFAGLAARYGGRTPPPEGPSPDEGAESAIEITCRVALGVNGLKKEVVQLAKGEQSPVLRRLAEDLLDFCQERGEAGLGARDLRDGLEKIARGALAPELLAVVLHRRTDPVGAPAGHQGFLLQIAGGRATTRSHHPREGFAEPVGLDLASGEVQALARTLAGANPEDLPRNLWARDYTDLSIRILGHRKSIQARPFGRLTPTTHGPRQQDFDVLVEALEALEQRVRSQGWPVSPAEPSSP